MNDSDTKAKYFVHRYSEWTEAKPGQYYQDYHGVAAVFENLDEAIEYAKKRFYKNCEVFKIKDDDCYYDNGKNKVFFDTDLAFAHWY